MLVIIILGSFASAALGISPAKKEIDFKPGESYTFNYRVISDNPDEVISLYSEGDFSEYVELSKDKIKGPGFFKATLNLPSEADEPGRRRLLIGAREEPPENEFLGSSIDIRAVIYIYVPYPGNYVDANLNIPNGNIKELIPVELEVINRGKNDLESVDVGINFYNGAEDLVYILDFNEVSIQSTESRYFRKYLNTSDFKPGDYLAEAVIDYGNAVKKVNKTVRVGSLFVNITGFTDKLSKGGLREFNIDLESLWNGDLDEVYADVLIENNVQNTSFRTPSIDLKAWNKGTLTGYINTNDLEGDYDVNIELSYAGEKSYSSGTLSVVDYMQRYIIIGIILAIVVILILIGVIIWLVKKRRK